MLHALMGGQGRWRAWQGPRYWGWDPHVGAIPPALPFNAMRLPPAAPVHEACARAAVSRPLASSRRLLREHPLHHRLAGLI